MEVRKMFLPPLLRVKNAPPQTLNHAPKVGIFDKYNELWI